MFSKSCEYALQAIIYIAFHQAKGYIGIGEIAKSQDIPAQYLSKLLQQLSRTGVLDSQKGRGGGFKLKVPMGKLTLQRVVGQIDGLGIFDKCAIGLKMCSDETPCPVHFEYKEVKDKVRALLREKTLKDICEDIEEGRSTIVNFKKS